MMIHTIKTSSTALLLCLALFKATSAISFTPTCTFQLDDGSIATFEKGASVHSYRPNRCTNGESFPCYCNPDAPGQIECPYCWLPTSSGDLLCANDGDSVTYTSLQGSLETCDCSVSDTEFSSFSTDCRPASAQARQFDTDIDTVGGDDDDDDDDEGDDRLSTIFGSNDDTCTIQGLTFDRGQPLGFAYDSKCAGPSFDFQCVCNPDLPTQIECPFCYFEARRSDQPLCLRDGEIATFEDSLGEVQTCGCTLDARGIARSECSLPVDSANTCAIELPDGSMETFVAGESLHRKKPSRCGAQFPCYCEPTILGQLWCPYCVYPEDKETLICANDGETITYTSMKSQQSQRCTCEVPLDPSEPPISTCAPTSGDPGFPPRDDDNEEVDNDDEGEDDGDQGRDFNSWRVCELEGNLYFEGENVGDSFVTRCGSPSDFPCYCNPDLNPPVECPYCGFALTKENLLCLKDEQIATFTDIYGDELTCGCIAPPGTVNPVQNCLRQPSDANTCIFRDDNGDPVTFNAGDAVDDELLTFSECGPNFPCYCDPTASNGLSCPFCVEVDFAGELICANEGEIAFFEDENGDTKRCTCEVPDNEEPSLNCGDSVPGRPSASPTRPPSVDPGNSCSIRAPSGETVYVPDGDSFGDLYNGECGSWTRYPAFCNADGSTSSDQIEYPYCVFENAFGQTICAEDNGSVSFVDATTTAVTCSCIYDTPPITQCFPDNGNPADPPGSAVGRTPSHAQQCVMLIGLLAGSAFYLC